MTVVAWFGGGELFSIVRTDWSTLFYCGQITLWILDELDELGELAKAMGFKKVASGPFVRSSYHARDMAETAV